MVSSAVTGLGPSLAILGAGGHGRVLADCATGAGWTNIMFFDSRPGVVTEMPWPISGGGEDLLAKAASFVGVVVGIGDNKARLDWHNRLSAAGANLVSVVHPSAQVSIFSSIGRGSVVFAGSVINIGARLGEAVIVNTGATVDHDCAIADGVHLSPGVSLAGGVSVGELSWVGIGAVVRENILIGDRATVGAGAVVVKPVSSGVTVVGSPARLLEGRLRA